VTNTRKILIVDDDSELREALVEQLALHEEFESIAVDNGTKGVQTAKAGQIDLVRRRALVLASASAIAGLSPWRRARAQARPITLKAVTPYTADFYLSKPLFVFKEMVEERTGGRLKIEHIGGPSARDPEQGRGRLSARRIVGKAPPPHGGMGGLLRQASRDGRQGQRYRDGQQQEGSVFEGAQAVAHS
jgi:CheY-like chemotaxis protein